LPKIQVDSGHESDKSEKKYAKKPNFDLLVQESKEAFGQIDDIID
jgi:hypothetical protein